MYSMGFRDRRGKMNLTPKVYFIPQDITNCGPEKETCVANQTLNDKECLVPCDGLYAYIMDCRAL